MIIPRELIYKERKNIKEFGIFDEGFPRVPLQKE